jgi:hypothetical protein
MVKYHGRRVTTDTDSGLTGNGTSNQRGQIFAAMPENGWLTGIGILGGKDIGQPNLTWRGAVFDVDGATLDQRLIYSGPVTVSNQMSFGGDGSLIQATVTGFKLSDGVHYGLGFSVTGGIFRFGMKQAALSPGEVFDYYFHKKNNASSIPTDPFGATSITYEGAMDMWLAYEANVKPTTTEGTMVPAGSITDTSPAFFGDWDDANEPQGDTPNQYQIQLREVGTTSLKWNTIYGFSSTEADDKRFSRAYGGTALTSGLDYEWRYRVSDQFGAWSDYSDWVTISLSGAGSVLISGFTPSGKQETQTPGPFTGQWTHSGGLSTNAVELRIKQGGTIIRSSPTITKTVAPGNTISISWAESTFAALAWGSSLVYNIRARATNGVWSNWSADRAFTINASPTIPSQLSPTGGATSSSRPLLRAKASDSDDTTGSGLAVSARIKNAAGTVLFTRAMTYNAATDFWEYQTTSTDLASFASYKWDASATDGTVTTAFSAEASFTYGAGPVITVTAPTEGQVLATHVPTITFTQDSTQVSYSVAIYLWDAVAGAPVGDPVYSSGTIVAAASPGAGASHQVPSGYLHNGLDYAAYVTSTNNLALSATSSPRLFSVVFPVLPAPTGVSIEPITVGNDATPSAVLITFDEPPYASDFFEGTFIWRKVAGADDSTAILLAEPLPISQRTFTDYRPASGVIYTYTIYFGVMQGTDSTETEAATGDTGVTLEHVVINSVQDGRLRAGLRYGAPVQIVYQEDSLDVPIWGQAQPHTFVGDLDQRIWSGTFELQDDRYSAGADDLAGLRALRASRDTVCYRDWQGTIIFGKLTMQERYGQRENKGEVSLTIRENDHREGYASA